VPSATPTPEYHPAQQAAQGRKGLLLLETGPAKTEQQQQKNEADQNDIARAQQRKLSLRLQPAKVDQNLHAKPQHMLNLNTVLKCKIETRSSLY
jgi:hypothetical protein